MTPARISVLLALILALGACSSPSKQAGLSQPNGSSSTSGSGASQDPGGGTVSPGAGSTSKPGSSGSTAKAAPSGDRTPFTLGDALSASVNENVPWGCQFRPGDSCRVPFTGGYYLHSKVDAFIVFKAFENGSKKAALTSSPLPAAKGQNSFQAVLPYKVGLTAKTVMFQGFMQDNNGKVLAQGKPHEFPVTPAA